MADKNLYKIFALIFAIFVYLLLIFTVVSVLRESAKLKKDYGFNVEDAIVVNIDSLVKDKPKSIENQKPKPIVLPPDPEPIPEPEPQKPEPIVLPPDPEPIPEEEEKPEESVEKESRDKEAKTAKDLFSTLRVDEYKKAMEDKRKEIEAKASRLKKQKAEKARKKAEAKRRKEKARKKALEAKKLVQQMQIATTASSHKKSGEKHEFWSFVSSKIMSKWQRTVSTQDGLSATVTIRIDNHGRLTYSDLKSSYNSLFDTKLKVFLDNLEYERFPSYKQGPYIEAEFEFTDKEKGL